MPFHTCHPEKRVIRDVYWTVKTVKFITQPKMMGDTSFIVPAVFCEDFHELIKRILCNMH